MYYLQSRYYDPQVCRFINADGYVSTGQGLLGNNMFAYCHNNPVNYHDSTGTVATPIIVAEVVLSGLVPAIVTLATGGSIEDAVNAFMMGMVAYGIDCIFHYGDVFTTFTSALKTMQDCFNNGLEFWETMKIVAIDVVINLIDIAPLDAGSDAANLFVSTLSDTAFSLCTSGLQACIYDDALTRNEANVTQNPVPSIRISKGTAYRGGGGGNGGLAFSYSEANYGHIY